VDTFSGLRFPCFCTRVYRSTQWCYYQVYFRKKFTAYQCWKCANYHTLVTGYMRILSKAGIVWQTQIIVQNELCFPCVEDYFLLAFVSQKSKIIFSFVSKISFWIHSHSGWEWVELVREHFKYHLVRIVATLDDAISMSWETQTVVFDLLHDQVSHNSG